MEPTKRRSLEKLVIAVTIVIWLISVSAGAVWLTRYSGIPGEVGANSPLQWPQSGGLYLDRSRMTLVMVVHPHCSCSRASLRELAEVMTRSQGHVAARVVFEQPAGAPDEWVHSDLWRLASEVPNVTVSVDRDGGIARAFHASTSGQIVLYDSAGRLLFAGGITPARGHEGPNAGVDAVLSALRGEPTADITTPVYGCSLYSPSKQETR